MTRGGGKGFQAHAIIGHQNASRKRGAAAASVGIPATCRGAGVGRRGWTASRTCCRLCTQEHSRQSSTSAVLHGRRSPASRRDGPLTFS